ncbi:MAG: branched-chain amino acid ABC transporter permease [Candidatus Bathycorpusculaceae bacterium]
MLESIIILGIISGLIYALIALGFTLVYGISGVVNLTHGAFMIIGAYLYGILLNTIPNYISPDFSYLTPLLAIILSCIVTGIIACVFYRLTLHQILGDEVAILVVSIIGCIVFHQLIYIFMGISKAFSFGIPLLVPGKITIINTEVLMGRTLAALISILVFTFLSLFITKTKTGRAMKALSQDLEAAMLVGISIEKLYMIASAISAGLASLGGILYTSTLTQGVAAWMWMLGLAVSFSVVVLGGLGSIKGSLLGGLIIGLSETAVMTIIPGAGVLQQSIPFIIIILVLLIRPKGLFGKRIEME